MMQDEGVFCTLPFFPLHCVEPFTVVATSPVEVFHAGGQNVRKISADCLSSIRKHLLWMTKDRIRQLPEDVAEVDTARLFDTTGDPFYRQVEQDCLKLMRQHKITYEELKIISETRLPTLLLEEANPAKVPMIPIENTRTGPMGAQAGPTLNSVYLRVTLQQEHAIVV
eukprot:g17917.t1